MEESLQNEKKPRFLLARIVVAIVAAVFVALSIFSLFGRQFLLAEIANTFRLQLSIALLLTTVFSIYSRGLRWFGMVQLVWLLVYAWPVYITFFPDSNNPEAGEKIISMLSINVLGENPDRQPVLESLNSADADIVVVIEYENGWIEPLKALERSYAFTVKEPRWHGFGVALYSKYKIVESNVHAITEDLTDNPVIVAEIKAGNSSFIVVTAHFLSPISREKMAIRNQQMMEVAELIQQEQAAKKLPVILVGDFNCVAWSTFARELLATAGLRDSRQGFFYQGSFPTDGTVVCIPIDNAFVSKEIHVHDRNILAANTSDHYPLYLEFSVTPTR